MLLLYESWGNMTFWLRFAAAVSTVALSLVSVGTSVDLHTAVTALQTNTSSTVAANTVTTDESSESVTDGTMPDNPTVALPETVDESISSDATVVAPDIAITNDGVAVDLQSGNEITDVEKVGDENTQPDPLAKTDGESFTPVDIETVRDAVEQQAEANGTGETVEPNTSNESNEAGGTNETAAWRDTKGNTRHSAVTAVEKTQSNEQQGGRVSTVALGNNEYGAYWGSYSGKPAFFESNKNPYIQDAKGVVDVSAWQGTIDWQKAKAAGVQGAIIRISYGWDNGFDPYALRNIRECKRLGIPFGVYSYSYSYDAASARAEGNDMVSLLRKAGVSPKDLGYPVFYDLEKWVWKGHNPPTNPAVYEQIVNTWMDIVRGAGYDGQVYSYANYIKNELNRSSIHKRVGWVASYGARAGFDISLDKRGWQYTSAGKVAGIAGNVDLNAFGVKSYIPEVQLMWVIREEDIAVGATMEDHATPVEYKWMSYNVNTQTWKDITSWTGANWAGWSDDAGTYWLHVEVRNAKTKVRIQEKTIAFAYVPGYSRISGTYAGYCKEGILLGVSSPNKRAKYKVKIYDTQLKKWVAQFDGMWNIWKPVKGIYWTHFELYTSDGRLVETKTYPFGV